MAEHKHPDKKQGNDEGRGTFLKGVLGAIALVIAWLFVLGWTYLHNYYRYFGINVNSLAFPTYHYLLFSFAQFVSFRLPGLFLALMMICILLLLWAAMSTRSTILAVLITAAYLAIFWCSFLVSAHNARSAAFHDMGPNSSLPQFVFELKNNPTFQDHTIQSAVEFPDLRLLLKNGDHIFVFEALDTDPEEMRTPYVRVLELDSKDLGPSVRVVRVK
jgi:hypothetical protein